MATYVNDLRLTELATGEGSGTWGATTNQSLELIGEALGYATQQVFGSDADATTTIADGASDPARAMYFKITSAGSLTATRTCTIAPNTVSRVMFIENATTGSQSIAISQGSGANVTIATGKTAVVYLDGAGSGAAVVDAMAGVDPGVTDTLTEVLVAGNTSGGTNIELSTTDKVQFRDSAIYINSSADGQLDIVADTEIQIATTTVDLNGNLDVSGTALVTGVLTTTAATVHTNGITMPDNAKAIFGAGSDLQIYHNGSNSYIQDVGTGKLHITSDGTGVSIDKGVSEVMATFDTDGAVTLYHNALVKLATSSSGISVTGTVTADGLDVNSITSGAANIQVGNASGDIALGIGSPSTANKVVVTAGGSVGLGTTAPKRLMHLNNAAALTTKIQITNLSTGSATDGDGFQLGISNDGTANIEQRENLDLTFSTNNTERMRIDASGFVGIGASSVNRKLEVAGNNNGGSKANFIRITDTDTSATAANPQGGIEFYTSDAGNENVTASIVNLYAGSGAGSELTFNTAPNGASGVQERLRIDESGNLLVVKTAIDSNTVGFQVDGGSGKIAATVSGAEAARFVRTTSDGEIVRLVKDTTTVGSIGSIGSDLYIAESTSGLRFDGENNQILPSSTTASTDGTCNLGAGSARFKDLYLSGGLITGGGGTSAFGEIEFVADSTRARIIGGYASGGGGYLKFHTDTTGGTDLERMRIDARGVVGINAVPEAWNAAFSSVLQVGAMSVLTSGGDNARIFGNAYYDGGATYKRINTGYAQAYEQGAGRHIWYNAASGAADSTFTWVESMRIDASGNLLVGTTDPLPAVNDVEGIALSTGSYGGRLEVSRSGGSPVAINRIDSFGGLIELKKAGTTVAAVSIIDSDPTGGGGELLIASGNTGLKFDDQVNYIRPANASGGGRDNIIDLGNSSNRFKDLYLSGVAKADSFQFAQNSAATGATEAVYRPTTGQMAFKTNSAERMRIDSSGNLLVGTTSVGIGDAGIELRADGQITGTRDGDYAALLNRLTSDGDIIDFRKDGTTVGSIGTVNGDMYLGTGDTGLFFSDGANYIMPYNVSTPGLADGLLDLGRGTNRFKDLYLSGGVYLGGTGAANKLEDYEEGTWTASVSAGAISGTDLRFQGSYTKVGRQVFISLYIDSTSGATDIQISSYASIAGIPFTIAKAGTSTVITEDIDVYARQGFAGLGGTTLAISAAGSSSGTSSLSIGIVGTTA